jgi:hypothetical protein
LVDIDTFIDLLGREARAAGVSSIGYAEEVFAGVESGLESNWSENALHFVILVGDSSSHPVGHEQNTTEKDETVLRLSAEEAQVHMLAIHLKDPRHPEDQGTARTQYSALSRIRGKGEDSAFVEIDTGETDTFQAAVGAITEEFSEILAQVRGGQLDMLEKTDREAGEAENEPEAVTAAKKATQDIAGAALVEYLGREADPPKDIIVWALDRDLSNPAIRTLDVRVIINKHQLSDLVVALDRIIGAMEEAELTQTQFFDALRGLSSQTMKNPEAIDQSATLAESGLVPLYLESLPYKSEISSLNAEMYASKTAEERVGLERSLRAKLQQYRDINEKVDGWVRLSETDPEMNKVYPLHLDYLP